MEIRFAMLDDLEQLIQMRWNYAKENYGKVDDDSYDVFRKEYYNFLFEVILSDEHFFWVAAIDEELIAHMSLRVTHGFPRPDQEQMSYAVITSAYTRRGYRERNIMESILDAIYNFSIEQELTSLFVSSDVAETSLFKKAGFEYRKPLLTQTDVDLAY